RDCDTHAPVCRCVSHLAAAYPDGTVYAPTEQPWRVAAPSDARVFVDPHLPRSSMEQGPYCVATLDASPEESTTATTGLPNIDAGSRHSTVRTPHPPMHRPGGQETGRLHDPHHQPSPCCVRVAKG